MWTPNDETQDGIRVLTIDDRDAKDSELFRRFAGADGITAAHARSRDDLEHALAHAVFDAVVADGAMDRSDLLDLPHVLDEIVSPAPGLVLCGGEDDTGLMRKAFLSDYADYLGAATSAGGMLFAAVARVADSSRLKREQAARQAEIGDLARRDIDTMLPNRMQLDVRLANLTGIDAPVRGLYRLALMRMEACEFVRRTFGLATWAALMRACAVRLADAARPNELVGRLDAETFYLLWAGSRAGDDPAVVLKERLPAVSSETLMDRRSFMPPARAVAVGIAVNGDPSTCLARAQALLADGNRWRFEEDAAREEIEVEDGAFPAWFSRSAARPETGLPDVSPPDGLPELEQGPEPVDAPAKGPDGRRERRADPRRRCLKRGALVLNNGFSTVDCVIRDLSRGGVRISTETHCFVPREVELLMHESGRRLKARRRWQVDEQAGLMFTGPGKAPAA